MLCERCGNHEASVHLARIINGESQKIISVKNMPEKIVS